MLELCQIVGLDVQIFLDFLWLKLQFLLVLPLIHQILLNSPIFTLELPLSFFLLSTQILDRLFCLLNKWVHLIDKFFTRSHNFIVKFQLMAIRQSEVTIDAYVVRVRIRLGQSSLNWAFRANRGTAHPAMVSLDDDSFEDCWTCLAGVSLIELVLLNYAELHREILEILTFLRVLWRLYCRLVQLTW